jgi:hypothetical protein
MSQRRRYPVVQHELKMRVWRATREAAAERGMPVAGFVRRAAEMYLKARRIEVAANAWLAMQRAILAPSFSGLPPHDASASALRPRPWLTS